MENTCRPTCSAPSPPAASPTPVSACAPLPNPRFRLIHPPPGPCTAPTLENRSVDQSTPATSHPHTSDNKHNNTAGVHSSLRRVMRDIERLLILAPRVVDPTEAGTAMGGEQYVGGRAGKKRETRLTSSACMYTRPTTTKQHMHTYNNSAR